MSVTCIHVLLMRLNVYLRFALLVCSVEECVVELVLFYIADWGMCAIWCNDSNNML
jgi:hypothetical protein